MGGVLAVLTTTGDRPECFALIERWMARQTRQPDLWVVSDNGTQPARPTMGQLRTRCKNRGGTIGMISNVLNGLESIPREADIVVMEDDDWYAADHVENMAAGLATGEMAVGCRRVRHYHVRVRRYSESGQQNWMIFAKSAFAASGRDRLERVFRSLVKGGGKACKKVWEGMDASPPSLPCTAVGIKGMPGRLGISRKHDVSVIKQWTEDPDMTKLTEWIGEDVSHYVRRADD